jgi:hypothetical protein
VLASTDRQAKAMRAGTVSGGTPSMPPKGAPPGRGGLAASGGARGALMASGGMRGGMSPAPGAGRGGMTASATATPTWQRGRGATEPTKPDLAPAATEEKNEEHETQEGSDGDEEN